MELRIRDPLSELLFLKILCKEKFMRENIGDREQKIRLAIGSAAAAAAVFAPLRYKWKGILSAVAATGLITGLIRYSPLKRVIGV